MNSLLDLKHLNAVLNSNSLTIDELENEIKLANKEIQSIEESDLDPNDKSLKINALKDGIESLKELKSNVF